jgi:hypothetical protein
MGSGKTTVLGEASDLLALAGVPHAAIDLDILGLGWVAGELSDDLITRNLAAVWQNYAAEGAARCLLAEALDAPAKRDRIRAAIPTADVVVCRLRATVATMQQRVRVREPGLLQAQFVARVAALDTALDAAALEDYSVDNDGRAITEVAREVLGRAGWL